MKHSVEVPRIGTAEAWRDAARSLLAQAVPPGEVIWQVQGAARGLFDAPALQTVATQVTVPRSFIALANSVVWHSDPERFARLYALAWRLQSVPRLMQNRADPHVAKLRQMEKAVRRCQHKMKAFVRFREVPAQTPGRRAFAAWFEPTHHTIEPTAAFFQRRFDDMDWCIVTPDVTVRCVDRALSFHTDQPRPDLAEDAHEALWTTYYCNIFNPARLKLKAMTSEMPKKYWKNMPETAAIPALLAAAETRVREMAEAAPTLPPLRVAAAQRQQRSFVSEWSEGDDAVIEDG